MKRFWLVLVALILAGTLGGQEVKHAPTVEQCQADQRLWLSKLEIGNRDVSADYKELHGWLREMMACKSVDQQFHNRYYNTAAEIQAEQLTRVEAFLDRHKLWQQFFAEDAREKRR